MLGPIEFSTTDLFDSDVVRIKEVVASAEIGARTEPKQLDENALVLPLWGLFTTHFGMRDSVTTTPSDALWLGAKVPLWYSFPGGIGDRSLVLSWSSAALADLVPEAVARDAINERRFARQVRLGAHAMLAHSLLRRRLRPRGVDALEIEEFCMDLLRGVLAQGRQQSSRGSRTRSAAAQRARRRMDETRALVAMDPLRRWTLRSLASTASMSPYHFARLFRREFGDIALDAQFANHSHFTASFRKRFGVTPQALRRRVARGRHSTAQLYDNVAC
jgi:AraC family transcriptional regulator